MAKPGAIRVEISLSGVSDVKKELAAKPAAVRRIIRGAMGKATRASAKRVKANVVAGVKDRRTGALQRAEGQKVVTYKDVVVGLVGARLGFAVNDAVYGRSVPDKYDHLPERGRTSSTGSPWLVLRFRSIAALRKFLDRRVKNLDKIVAKKAPPSAKYKEWLQIARRYGRFIADRVAKNNRGQGFVLFLKKVGPAPAFRHVERDEVNLASEAAQIINSDLTAKL